MKHKSNTRRWNSGPGDMQKLQINYIQENFGVVKFCVIICRIINILM